MRQGWLAWSVADRAERILFWGINYAPEVTGIAPYTTEWAEWLVARGHSVRVVSTFPYYPEWRKSPGDARKWRRREVVRGVEVVRCWHYVPRRPSAVRRMVHEASFVAASADVVLRSRPDRVVVVLPPLALAAAARVLCRLKGTPYEIHVQDLQPDAAVALGMLNPGAFTRLLYWVESFGYRGAVRVSSIVPAMVRRIEKKPAAAGRTFLLPNWLRGRAPEVPDAEALAALRARLHVPPGAMLVTYAGNLGAKQGLQVLVEVARLLERDRDPGSPPVHVRLIGNGVEADVLAESIRAAGVSNLALFPLLPKEDYAALLHASDVCLVTQRLGTGDYFFPSKLLSLWQAGRPVLAAADPGGALDAEVRMSGGGWSVPAEDPAALAAALREIAALPRTAREERGTAGRRWATRYERDTVLGAWLSASLTS